MRTGWGRRIPALKSSLARAGRLDQFFPGADQGAKSFGQKFGIEWLLKGFINRRAVKAQRAAVIGQQRDQDRFGEVDIFAQILANLQSFNLSDREVHDDTVGVEAFRLDASFKSAGG